VQLSSTEGPEVSAIPDDEWNHCISSLDFDSCVDTLAQLHSIEALVRIMQLDCVAALINSGRWPETADRDRIAWLGLHLGISRRDATDLVQLAVLDRPHLRAAYLNGDCDWAHFVLACRVAESLEDDARLADEISTLSINQLKVMLARKRAADSSTGAVAKERRFLSLRHNEKDQITSVRGEIPLDLGVAIQKVLEQKADSYGKDPATGEYDSHSHRMADAFCDLVLGESKVNVELMVDIDVEAFGQGGAGDLEGFQVTQEVIQRLACEGSIRPAFSRDGTTIGVGRKARLCPPWLSRVIRKRDRGCRFPGCEQTLHVAEHHMAEWDDDAGPTDADNVIQICPSHHRYLHDYGWKIRGKPDGNLVFVAPDGQTLTGRAPKPSKKVKQVVTALATAAARANATMRENADTEPVISSSEADAIEHDESWGGAA
jgi:hypothetical protein